MYSKHRIAGTLLILGALILMACAPKVAPAPGPQPPAPAAAPAAPAVPAPAAVPARLAWQDKWDATVAAARHEGRVVIYTVAGGGVLQAMRQIAKMQGIEAEVLSMRAAESLTKIFAERRAGLYLTDFHIDGVQSIVVTAKPAGIVEPIDSAFIMPHLTDPDVIKQVWFQGKIPFADQDHTVLLIALQPGTAITVNTELVKPDEVKSWRDLLNPKWSGKVALNDPTTSGYGPMCVQTMANLMGEDFVKELANSKPIIIRDQRQLVEWVARGKVAIAIAVPVEMIVEFTQAGAPIKVVLPQEGTWLGPGNAGGLAWLKNPPHPNASKVFLNMITSKEGQDIFAPSGGFHGTREDASSAHLLPGLARTQGGKYFPAYTEESYLKRPANDKWAKELFGPLVK